MDENGRFRLISHHSSWGVSQGYQTCSLILAIHQCIQIQNWYLLIDKGSSWKLQNPIIDNMEFCQLAMGMQVQNTW